MRQSEREARRERRHEELIETEGGPSPADELLDELMPPDFEWRRIVRRHPIPALLVAAAAGYWLGRSRSGTSIAEGVASSVALGLSRQLVDFEADEPIS